MNVPNPTGHRRRAALTGLLLGALGGFIFDAYKGWEYLHGSHAMTIIVIATLVGGVVGFVGWNAWLTWIDAALLASIFVAAYTPIMSVLAPRWVRSDSMPQHVDAVMALSSTVRSNGRLSDDGLERLLYAVRLARADSSAILITSRVRVSFSGKRVNSDAEQALVAAEAGLSNRWIVVDSVNSTHDEALQAARVLLPRGKSRIAVVTTPMHTRRACATFEAVGFRVVCQAAPEHETVTWRPTEPPDRVAALADYVYELLGMVKYRARGWVRSH
jgi:uncharacterized SAM-binding protein YcdF (DUF218 family)